MTDVLDSFVLSATDEDDASQRTSYRMDRFLLGGAGW
jgi:hypothetical protein